MIKHCKANIRSKITWYSH